MTVTLTQFASLNNGQYIGDFFGTGDPLVVDSRSSTKFVFHNPDNPGGFGSTVTVTGTGFKYDSDNVAYAGTITSVTVKDAGAHNLVTITGLSVAMDSFYAMFAGWNDGNGSSHQGGNGYDILTTLTNAGVTYVGTSGGDNMVAGSSPGDDIVNAGGGNDFINTSRGNDTYNGGAGNDDVLNYGQSIHDATVSHGVTVNLATGTATNPWGGTDTISGIEEVWGSGFGDDMTGDSHNNYFAGMRGDDTINGGGGALNGALYFHDVQYGGNHGIKADLSTGQIVDGWGDTDTVTNIQYVAGTKFADVLTGGAGDDTLEGIAGKDSFNGGGGTNMLVFWHNQSYGGTGATVDLSASKVTNDGFGNVETATNIQNLSGSDLDDTLKGSTVANYLQGNGGSDTLDGLGGNDTLEGNDGADKFVFSTTPDGSTNHDVINDFSGSTGQGDTIELSHAVFTAIAGTVGSHIASSQFQPGGGTATTSTQHVVWNSATGDLYYDSNGSGSGGQVLIAHLNDTPALAAVDIILIA